MAEQWSDLFKWKRRTNPKSVSKLIITKSFTVTVLSLVFRVFKTTRSFTNNVNNYAHKIFVGIELTL